MFFCDEELNGIIAIAQQSNCAAVVFPPNTQTFTALDITYSPPPARRPPLIITLW